MSRKAVKNLVGKVRKRSRRGTPTVKNVSVEKTGELGEEYKGSLEATFHNDSDRTVRLITAEVRELNGHEVVQRGSVDEVTLKPDDHSVQELDFTAKDDIFEEENDVTVRVRATVKDKLFTAVQSFENL
jgi:hypothetical protein